MSRSINDLLGALGVSKTSLPPPEGQLKNPDIPEIDEKEEIRDRYYNNFKTPTMPRNGTFSLPRASSIMYSDPKKDDFLLDRSIDPNVIRAKTDPDNALPTLAGGVEYSLMPSNVRKPHSQVNLIKMSHESEYNYRNRYTPSQQQQQ